LEQALELDPDERAELVDALMSSLHKTDPEIDAAWVREAHRRLAALDAGETETLTESKFFAGLE
jgi:putative addiction module component (TIGR02574 family)